MVEWLYLELNNKKLRINPNDSMDIYSWKECKTRPSYWFKNKPNLHILKSGYKYYRIKINKKSYRLSRIVYKAHNKDWDITDISINNFIDHINTNSLDNRIENLRVVTQQQNQWNRNAKGYSWDKNAKKWHAKININGKDKYLGLFDNEEDAHISYLNAKEIHHKI